MDYHSCYKFQYYPNFWEIQNLNLKSQKCSICVPLRALLVCFKNRHQYVSFRHWYIITWGGGWKGNQILKHKFSFTVMRKLLLEFSTFISGRCDMFLTKVQQSYCYTQLCNYREEFLIKPISNQLNILLLLKY